MIEVGLVYRILADAAVVLHLGFVLFVVAGGLGALRWRWWPWVHLPAAAWGVWISVSGRICPLTPLENRWRRLAGQDGYEGGFVEHYLLGVLYPEGLTRGMQWGLAAFVLLANAAIYAVVLARARRARRRA